LERSNDIVRLCGEVAGRPELSHMGRDGAYYRFPLAVERLSGAVDTLNIVVREDRISELIPEEKPRLRVTGEVRTYNNRTGEGPKLVITVLAKTLEFTDDEPQNYVYLSGTVCKTPNLRKTPMGREICDVLIAVNRHSGRSDYLPCIAWGLQAKTAAGFTTGTRVELEGRMQSRVYLKTENDIQVEKTAFEISAVKICEVGGK